MISCILRVKDIQTEKTTQFRHAPCFILIHEEWLLCALALWLHGFTDWSWASATGLSKSYLILSSGFVPCIRTNSTHFFSLILDMHTWQDFQIMALQTQQIMVLYQRDCIPHITWSHGETDLNKNGDLHDTTIAVVSKWEKKEKQTIVLEIHNISSAYLSSL